MTWEFIKCIFYYINRELKIVKYAHNFYILVLDRNRWYDSTVYPMITSAKTRVTYKCV